MKTEPVAAKAREVWDRAGDGLLVAGLFVVGLLLYVPTLAPSVAALFDDSLEFPLVAHELAIAHQTGYPLYTLLGRLFILVPWGDVARRVNLLSAVAGALTVVLAFLVTRQLTRRRIPAFLGAVALAASPVFWSQSTIAEVYTLNAAFVAAMLLLALHWARRPLLPVTPFSLLQAPPKERASRLMSDGGFWARVPLSLRRAVYRVYTFYRGIFPAVPPQRRLQLHPRIFALAALYGLSLTHHRTMLLLIPALFIFFLMVELRVLSRAALLGPERPDRPGWLQLVGRPVVLLILCFVLPLLLYLYLPIRGHVGSLDGTYTNTWSGFWRWVMASNYGTFLGENPLARDLDAAFYAGLFWRQFGPVGLALAVVGLIGLVRRPKALALTGLAFLTYVAFAVAYRVPDVEVFFIPAFLLVAVWIGVGLDDAADLIRIRGQSLAVRRLLAVCGVLLFLAAVVQPLFIAGRNYPDLDLSRRWIVHDYGRYLLAQELPLDSSTVVGLGGEETLLRYFQETAGLRPDIDTIRADDETARREAVDAALAQGRTVFITRPLPGLAADRSLGSVTGVIDVVGDLETLIHVGDPSYEGPALPRQVGEELIPGLELLGYGLRQHEGHWQAWARLRLWWQAPGGLTEAFKVSARLVDAAGQVVAATDAEPVAGAYPAPTWHPGEVVADAYEIPLPAGLPPGEYRPLIIVYEPATGAELGRIELSPVQLAGNPERPPRQALEASVSEPTYARFGEVELLGFTPPDPEMAHLPGDALPLVLLWQASDQPRGDLWVGFWLEGAETLYLGEEPVGGSLPASGWTAGQVVRQQTDLQVPSSATAGTYQLRMRVSRDGQPVPWGRGLVPVGSDLLLGHVHVGR